MKIRLLLTVPKPTADERYPVARGLFFAEKLTANRCATIQFQNDDGKWEDIPIVYEAALAGDGK